MDKTQIKILLIEDNPVDVILLREALNKDAFSSFEINNTERLKAAITLLKKESFDIILLDLGLPDSQGLDTFTSIHQVVPEAPKVIFSGLSDETFALQAVSLGAQDYLIKGAAGFSAAARAIRYAIERKLAGKKMAESEERFSTAFFTSPISQSIIDPAKGEILAVNDACCNLFEYGREELIGADPAKLNL